MKFIFDGFRNNLSDLFIEQAESIAAALYDGGWRTCDREHMIAEYDMTAGEADVICRKLKEYEADRGFYRA